MGLWLSAPGLQDIWAVVSVISSIVTASGGPGGPVVKYIHKCFYNSHQWDISGIKHSVEILPTFTHWTKFSSKYTLIAYKKKSMGYLDNIFWILCSIFIKNGLPFSLLNIIKHSISELIFPMFSSWKKSYLFPT